MVSIDRMETSEIISELNQQSKTKIQHKGWEFYTKILGSPKYVVAPMVDQSELAWRMLCRRHGAQLCYSPMFHSNLFAKDPKYRKEALQTCSEDRPLIIQFCGNDPKIVLEAALLAQDYCDAIDINLGCPQAIAKRGHYGAFLQDEWDLLSDIVGTLHKHLRIPVTCKARIFPDKQKTLDYVKMLQNSGCQLLTLHGRTREQKGPVTGLADWSYIKLVREHLDIPMFSNGNILSLEDVHRCLDETKVQGVMSAEGNLYNPAIFEGIAPTTWDMASEYLDLVELYPCPISYIRGHLFKLFHHLLNFKSNTSIRESLATAREIFQFRFVVNSLKDKYQVFHEGKLLYEPEETEPGTDKNKIKEDYNLSLPPWICQPYIRPPPEEHKKIIEEKNRIAEDPNTIKRQYYDIDGNEISRKRMKKLRRKYRRPQKSNEILTVQEGKILQLCDQCINPMGIKCERKLCRICCRDKCYNDNLDCAGHKIFIKTKREKAKQCDKIK